MEISVQRNTDVLSEAAPLAQLFWHGTKLPQRGSANRCSEGRDTLWPIPSRGAQPEPVCLSVRAGVRDLPGLVQGCSHGAVPAGCHGDVEHCHLPALSLGWDRTLPSSASPLGRVWARCACWDSSGCVAHPLSHHQTQARAQCWPGEGRRCQGEPCGFPPFPFCAFSSPFLPFPGPWLDHQMCISVAGGVGFAELWRGPRKIKH